MGEHGVGGLNGDEGASAAREAQALRDGCTACGACLRECAFLQRFGTPGDQASQFLRERTPWGALNPYACSLCGLCGAVCPEGLSPGRFFLALRREAVRRGAVDWRPYRSLLAYEVRGRSPWLTWRHIPQGCRTVFFPGCALPGTHPRTVLRLAQALREGDPSAGVVLDCCVQPSHDLGRQDFFEGAFRPLAAFLEEQGVRRVVTACPSCHKVFRTYAAGLEVVTVWEAADVGRLFAARSVRAEVFIHDPCPHRNVPEAREAIRRVVRWMGLAIREPRRTGNRTLCCGEGGAVGHAHPDLARRWAERRKAEAGRHIMVTSCAGCTSFLRRGGLKAVHLADFVEDPERAVRGRSLSAGWPRTDWNRWRLKHSLKKIYGAP